MLTVLLACVLPLSLVGHVKAEEAVPVPADAEDAEAAPEPRIILEAELPEGFPSPGPAGEVLRKSYPAYRVARTDKPEPFNRLFNHIQKHGIPMTAPVEMTMEPGQGSGDGRVASRMEDMMFMYASTDVGTLGPDGDVEVVDLPAMEVLSYGFFGPMDDAHLTHALSKVEQALADDDTLESAGPARVLGYNSPLVPEALRYTEVQVPVRAEATDEATEEASE